MSNLFRAFNKAVNKGGMSANGQWIAVPAIVAKNNDPEKRHRIKVIIPMIDEDVIFDEWLTMFAPCLGDGFGFVAIPPVGSEVLLFGTFGQKYTFYCVSIYNDEMAISSGLGKDAAGIHAPKDLKLIAEKTAQVKGKDVNIEAANKADITGIEIELNGTKVSIDSKGIVSINGTSVSIDGANVTILGRTVLRNGLPI